MGAVNRRCWTALASWRIVSGKEWKLLAINRSAAVSRTFGPRERKGPSNSTFIIGRTRILGRLPITLLSMRSTAFPWLQRKRFARGEKAKNMDNRFLFFV